MNTILTKINDLVGWNSIPTKQRSAKPTKPTKLSKLSKPAFTLIELLVVVAMIMILAGTMTVSMKGANERARIQRATAEVNIITQAILAYENETKDGDKHELPSLNRADCDSGTVGFLLGRETSQSGKIPVLLMAALSSGGKMLDPWGHPYKVTIKKSSFRPNFKTMTGSMQTGFFLPNFHRLREGER